MKMKKLLILVLAAAVMFMSVGCSGGDSSDDADDTADDTAETDSTEAYAKGLDWPVNEYTDGLPEMPFTITAIEDSPEERKYTITCERGNIEDVKKYAEALKEAGFTHNVDIMEGENTYSFIGYNDGSVGTNPGIELVEFFSVKNFYSGQESTVLVIYYYGKKASFSVF